MELNLTPIGGLSEIGSNMFAVDDGEVGFVIDFGLLFPADGNYDIDYLFPDFSHLSKDIYQDLVITHGHEDHIGAISKMSYFGHKFNVHCTEFAGELIKAKNKDLRTNIVDSKLEIGNFQIYFIPVNHSIPETMCLVIHHKKMDISLLYNSDFKIDKDALFETPINLLKIKSLQNKKINMAFIDSTNILVPSAKCSEKTVADTIGHIINEHKDRIFITMFSSNLHRIRAIYNLCKENKRTLYYSGRSIGKYINAGIQTNILPADFKVDDADQVENISERSVILITGCQGDFFGSLRRFSAGEHAKLKPRQTDLVIFSSKSIPGNEKTISKITNNLIDKKVKVINTSLNPYIHSSGHASKEEIKYFIENLNITHYVPIHGESFFLKEHFDFVKDSFPKIESYELRNHDSIKILNSEKVITRTNEAKPLKIVLSSGQIVDKSIVSQRRKMAAKGVLIVCYNTKNKKIIIENIGNHIDETSMETFKNFLVSSFSSVGFDFDNEKSRLIALKYVKNKLEVNPIIKIIFA